MKYVEFFEERIKGNLKILGEKSANCEDKTSAGQPIPSEFMIALVIALVIPNIPSPDILIKLGMIIIFMYIFKEFYKASLGLIEIEERKSRPIKEIIQLIKIILIGFVVFSATAALTEQILTFSIFGEYNPYLIIATLIVLIFYGLILISGDNKDFII